MAAQSLLHSQKCSSYICHKSNCRCQNPWRNFWAGYENHQVGQQRQHSQLQTCSQCQDQIIRTCKKIRRGKFDAHQADFAERTRPWFMDILNSCRPRRDHCSVDSFSRRGRRSAFTTIHCRSRPGEIEPTFQNVCLSLWQKSLDNFNRWPSNFSCDSERRIWFLRSSCETVPWSRFLLPVVHKFVRLKRRLFCEFNNCRCVLGSFFCGCRKPELSLSNSCVFYFIGSRGPAAWGGRFRLKKQYFLPFFAESGMLSFPFAVLPVLCNRLWTALSVVWKRGGPCVEQIQLTESDECSDVLHRTRRVSMNRGGNRTVAGNMMMRTCVWTGDLCSTALSYFIVQYCSHFPGSVL